MRTARLIVALAGIAASPLACGEKPQPLFGDAGTSTDDEPPFDCSTVPDAPFSVEELVGPIAYHDLAFDSAGYLIGSDGNQMFKADSSGTTTPFGSPISGVQGMDYLPNGSLVAASGGSGLVRIAPDGTQTPLNSSLVDAYGVTVGPDGMVYVADNASLYRVDPASGETETLLSGSPIAPRGIEFTPDGSRMYLSSFCTEKVFVAELDGNYDIVGEPAEFAAIPGSCYEDGIGVDVCGNVYIPVYGLSQLFRITPEGEVTVYYQFDATTYGHGLEWGGGAGGWDDQILYLSQPYDSCTVVAVDIGVPYRE
jgi:hypothetical protein